MAKTTKTTKSAKRPLKVAPGATSKKLTEARKTFQQDGHWIVKPRKTPIEMCACGTRYLKTRPGQKVCLRCLFAPQGVILR